MSVLGLIIVQTGLFYCVRGVLDSGCFYITLARARLRQMLDDQFVCFNNYTSFSPLVEEILNKKFQPLWKKLETKILQDDGCTELPSSAG